jgi:hypothetical protein
LVKTIWGFPYELVQKRLLTFSLYLVHVDHCDSCRLVLRVVPTGSAKLCPPLFEVSGQIERSHGGHEKRPRKRHRLARGKRVLAREGDCCPGAVHRHATGAIVGPADNNESALDFETSDDDKTIDDLPRQAQDKHIPKTFRTNVFRKKRGKWCGEQPTSWLVALV